MSSYSDIHFFLLGELYISFLFHRTKTFPTSMYFCLFNTICLTHTCKYMKNRKRNESYIEWSSTLQRINMEIYHYYISIDYNVSEFIHLTSVNMFANLITNVDYTIQCLQWVNQQAGYSNVNFIIALYANDSISFFATADIVTDHCQT